MASEVKLPRLGQGMESGTIVKWLKGEGDPVEKGEPLYELDTDKVTQEVEAEASGVLLKIAVPEGEVPVGRTIAVIGEQGEEVSVEAEPEPEPEQRKAEEPEGAPPQEPVPQEDGQPEDGRPAPVEQQTGGRVKASPLARRIARERGIDLASLRGTGPEGRIVAEDVERAQAVPAVAPVARGPVPTGEVERRELTNVRRTIARRLTEAWQIPVFQLQVSADMTRVNSLLARLREDESAPKTTVTDVLTKVCAAALMLHREVNAQFTDEAIVLYPTANVGLAVAAPQGLVVPVIRSAERLTLAEIADGARRSRRPARARGSCSERTSRRARSRSRTSACSASTASRRCSTRPRRRSWPSARRSSERCRWTASWSSGRW